MKRHFAVLAMAIICFPMFVQAGGLMTNTNQSASYIRMPVLDAVVGPEGVYYNPAGLAFLSDGLHFSVSNQSILQRRTINSNFPGMNRDEFIGTVTAPLFPSVYATYKRDRLAFSLGFNPIGGGGSALFEEGLPSFEQMVAMLPAGLSQAGIPTTQYDFDTRFDAQSIFWGLQANASYAVNSMLSVSAGIRYVTANNTYNGYLTDITINPNLTNHPQLGGLAMLYNGSMQPASTFFGTLGGLLNEQATSLATVAGALQGIINQGGGELTLSQVPGMTPTEVAMISGGLAQIGYTGDPSVLRINQIHAIYGQAYVGMTQARDEMYYNQTATLDRAVDVRQRGASIAPIFGLHLRLTDRINLALKYEHITPLTVKNETTTDDLGVYPDGMEVASNLPSMLSVGGSFGITDRLTLSTGMHYYFDKSADYGKIERWENGQPIFLSNEQIIDNNFWEAGLGFEYKLTRSLLVSAGYLRTQTGVNEKYHSDMSHSLSTNTLGTGVRWQFTNLVAINVGALYSHYISHSKAFSTNTTPQITYKEEYNRSNMVVALGIDLKF